MMDIIIRERIHSARPSVDFYLLYLFYFYFFFLYYILFNRLYFFGSSFYTHNLTDIPSTNHPLPPSLTHSLPTRNSSNRLSKLFCRRSLPIPHFSHPLPRNGSSALDFLFPFLLVPRCFG